MNYDKNYNSYKNDYDDDYSYNSDNDYNDNFYSNEDYKYNDNDYDKDGYIKYTDDSYDDLQPPKRYKSINAIFDDGEDSEDDDDDSSLMHTVDNDLAGYFSDARLGMPKKKMVDTMKKKPKRITYKAGDQVTATINRQTVTGTILFGPYESNKKQMYQLELDNGEIAEAEEK